MSRKHRYLGAFVLFSILGFGKLWLWHRSNQYGLYWGLAFAIYAAWCLFQALSKPSQRD